MSVNERQVGGDHYKSTYHHWDVVARHGLGYLEGNATKYLVRWHKKDGVKDLGKALHYVDKMVELREEGCYQKQGHAPLEEVGRFLAANPMDLASARAVATLLQWTTTKDLREVRQEVVSLIDLARAASQA